MNPDKLFDYLDGKLPATERAQLEEQLMASAELRQELKVARQIHSEMRDSREIVGVATPTEQRGAVLARRIGIVFAVLVVLNVLFGIYAIAFLRDKKQRQISVERNRNELTQTLARTAAVALPTPSLDVEEIKFTAPIAEQDALANAIVDEAKAVGGTATKGLADEHGILIFAEIPALRLEEFRLSLKKLGGSEPPPPAASGEKTILQVRIVSAQ
jgi:predicted DNA repair protein MutK